GGVLPRPLRECLLAGRHPLPRGRGRDPRGAGGVGMSFTWESALQRIAAEQKIAAGLGGEDRVQRQHDQGRLTIRERIAAIAEEFTEVGEFAGFTVRDASGNPVGRLPSSYVCGLATVDGR